MKADAEAAQKLSPDILHYFPPTPLGGGKADAARPLSCTSKLPSTPKKPRARSAAAAAAAAAAAVVASSAEPAADTAVKFAGDGDCNTGSSLDQNNRKREDGQSDNNKSCNTSEHAQEEPRRVPSIALSADTIAMADVSSAEAAAEATMSVISSAAETTAPDSAPSAIISSGDSTTAVEVATACLVKEAAETTGSTKTLVQSSVDTTASLADSAMNSAMGAVKDSAPDSKEAKLPPLSPSSSSSAADAANPAFHEVEESDETVALRVRR